MTDLRNAQTGATLTLERDGNYALADGSGAKPLLQGEKFQVVDSDPDQEGRVRIKVVGDVSGQNGKFFQIHFETPFSAAKTAPLSLPPEKST